jgi:hypothetical protein
MRIKEQLFPGGCFVFIELSDVLPGFKELIDLLGEWWGELGSPTDDQQLVFPADDGGYLRPDVILRRALYPAMKKAKIQRIGPMSERSRTFQGN